MRRKSFPKGVITAAIIFVFLSWPALAKELIKCATEEAAPFRAIYYGLTEGKVKSDLIDVKCDFLSIEGLIEAGRSPIYDVQMQGPLAIPLAAERGFKYLVVAAGLEIRGGDMVLVRADSPIKDVSGLKGRSLAVAALRATFVSVERYVLKHKYGFNPDFKAGDVNFVEVPLPATPALLSGGKIDAAILVHDFAYKTWKAGGFRVIQRISNDFKDLTGDYSLNTVEVTFPGTAAAKGPAIREFRRLLKASVEYMERNRAEVFQEVAKRSRTTSDYLQWWFDNHYFSAALEQKQINQLLTMWKAAKELGDIKGYPPIEEVILR